MLLTPPFKSTIPARYAIKMFEFLYKPQVGISYDFIYYSYSVSAAICLLLFVLEYLEVEAMKGYWIVFAPFYPCWVWAYLMRASSKKLELEIVENDFT